MLNLLAMAVTEPRFKWPLLSIPWSIETICIHTVFDRSLFFGGGGVPPCWRHLQIPSITQTGMPNYDPFFASSFDCNFQRNDNQTFNVYTESTLSLYRKGLCSFFLVLKFALEDF